MPVGREAILATRLRQKLPGVIAIPAPRAAIAVRDDGLDGCPVGLGVLRRSFWIPATCGEQAGKDEGAFHWKAWE